MDFHYVLDFVIGNSWGVMGLGNLKVSCHTFAFLKDNLNLTNICVSEEDYEDQTRMAPLQL